MATKKSNSRLFATPVALNASSNGTLHENHPLYKREIKTIDLYPIRKTTSQSEINHSNLVNEGDEKVAIITGINGQDGSYLAELLVSKNYIVHGVTRRDLSSSQSPIRRLCKQYSDRIRLHCGDLSDSSSLYELIFKIKPHEVYNLAAQSHVKISFELPEVTGNTNALGTLRLLEAIKRYQTSSNGNTGHKIKFYQASTSELFGGSMHQVPQNERTPFYPRSPYGCAKLYAHSLVVNYRETYGLFAVNGILFNHESPRRGENFVTRKITRAVAEIKLNQRQFFELGNLDARRDWGHARDYVEAMWLMMQQLKPKDYVIATGTAHTVREFVTIAFKVAGLPINWRGSGLNEVAIDSRGIVRVRVNQEYFRPSEVDHLLGDPSLAKKELGWNQAISFEQLIEEMVRTDLEMIKKEITP